MKDLSPGQNVNLVLPECEAEMLTTRQWWSVILNEELVFVTFYDSSLVLLRKYVPWTLVKNVGYTTLSRIAFLEMGNYWYLFINDKFSYLLFLCTITGQYDKLIKCKSSWWEDVTMEFKEIR